MLLNREQFQHQLERQVKSIDELEYIHHELVAFQRINSIPRAPKIINYELDEHGALLYEYTVMILTSATHYHGTLKVKEINIDIDTDTTSSTLHDLSASIRTLQADCNVYLTKLMQQDQVPSEDEVMEED
ncbi:hypothetical protein K7432_014354 [Basidiobolus ranarum]|uniref:Uncharacterized protein n=1 Tax=Basidiobolus ranarum TaxID=34480 RepID=A0ABR2VPS1_9FUNG